MFTKVSRASLFGVLAVAYALSSASFAADRRAASAVNWPGYNDDVGSNRYAAIAQLSKATVGSLHVVCTAQLGQFARFETGPIEVNGTIFATTADDTFAISATTCAPLWENAYVPTNKTGATNRGVAYAQGMLFRGFPDGHVIAIDASTGRTLWNQSIIAAGSHEFISAAPLAWNGSIVIGTGNGDNAVICHVAALDQASGKILWTIATITSGKTWKGAQHLAGGATWTSFSVDAATGKLYVPVGNPGPDYDTRLRKGANLNTNSVLELDPATGALLRGLQVIPNDFHDWDQAAAPAIVTLKSGGKIMLTAGKDGYLRGVNLATFASIWKTPVTTISNATAPITTQGTHFCPGGAVYWNGPAYSPATGLAFINAVDWCKTVVLSATPQPFVPGQPWLGTADGDGVHDPTNSGWLTAIDATTGVVRWRYHSPTPLLAGVTATSGGVVLTADLSGNVLAFDAARGTQLASVNVGAAVGGGLIAYEVAGSAYVATAVGLSSPLFNTPQTETSIVVLGVN